MRIERSSPIVALSRRAKRLLLLALAPLLPPAALLLLALLQPHWDSGLSRWAVDYWWSIGVIAAPLFLLLSLAPRGLLRCPGCRYRLARSGITAQHLLRSDAGGIRHCPHCGLDWRAGPSRNQSDIG